MTAVYAGRTGASRGKPSSQARKQQKPDRIAVKVGRRGRRLEIDGTFASWYAPGATVTGSVWVALAAPILLLPPARRRSVLILGLGGGSAARIARALAPRATIVGVERDADVVRAARCWFDLDDLGIEVIQGDALAYLGRARRQFDVVIEDIFVGRGRAVRKPDWLPDPGLSLAARRVAHGGLLVSNAIDEAPEVGRRLRGLFPATLRIDIDDYDNRVLVGGPALLSGRALRGAVAHSPVLRESSASLRFRRVS